MKEIQKLLLEALVKISAGENDEAHELVLEAVSSLPTHAMQYTHRHGDDFFLLRYEGEGDPSQDEIVSALDLNFEPDREEFIDVSPVPDVCIVQPLEKGAK